MLASRRLTSDAAVPKVITAAHVSSDLRNIARGHVGQLIGLQRQGQRQRPHDCMGVVVAHRRGWKPVQRLGRQRMDRGCQQGVEQKQRLRPLRSRLRGPRVDASKLDSTGSGTERKGQDKGVRHQIGRPLRLSQSNPPCLCRRERERHLHGTDRNDQEHLRQGPAQTGIDFHELGNGATPRSWT